MTSSMRPTRANRRHRQVACFVSAAVLLAAGTGHADEAVDFFKQNCVSCHTIGGGRLTGPDLKDATVRRDPAWLARFISDPKKLIDGGDAQANQLLQEYRGVLMPTVSGMTPTRAEALVRLIGEESKLPKSQFLAPGGEIPDRPFTPAEIQRGRDLFMGSVPLAKGGPACASCHSVHGIGILGGGRLGPDLTQAFGRLSGRKGLAGWLSSPASATMQPVYRSHPLDSVDSKDPAGLGEIALLLAFLEKEAQEVPEAGNVTRLTFLLLGLGGAVGCFVLMDFLWRFRFRSVRSALVGGKEKDLS